MENQFGRLRITPQFNVALFLFSAAIGIFSFLLSDRTHGVPLIGLVLSIMVDAVRYLVVLLIGAYFVRELWNRLIAEIFSLRALEYQEGIALVLIAAIVVP